MNWKSTRSRSGRLRVTCTVLAFAALAGVLVSLSFPTTAAADAHHVCNYENLCLNRAAFGTSAGTRIVGWPRTNQGNENFQEILVGNWCVNPQTGYGGLVTSNCPFSSSALNHRYLGNPIVEFKDGTTGMCLAADVQDDKRLGALEPCGTTGYVFIANAASGTRDYIENFYWSNRQGSPSWLCYVPGTGNQVWIQSGDWGGQCRWVSY